MRKKLEIFKSFHSRTKIKRFYSSSIIITLCITSARILADTTNSDTPADAVETASTRIERLNEVLFIPKNKPSITEQISCSKNIISATIKNILYIRGRDHGDITKMEAITPPDKIYATFLVNKIIHSRALTIGQEIIVELPHPEFLVLNKYGVTRAPGFPTFTNRMNPIYKAYGKEHLLLLGEIKTTPLTRDLQGNRSSIEYYPFSVMYADGIAPMTQARLITKELEKQSSPQPTECDNYINRLNSEIITIKL